MSAPARQRLDERLQLARLRDLRETRALRAWREAQAREQTARQQVAACEARVEVLREQRRENVEGRVVGGWVGLHAHAFVDRRISDLEESVERATDDLIEAREALDEAMQAVVQTHAQWVQARARKQGAEDEVVLARRAHAHEREQREIREIS